MIIYAIRRKNTDQEYIGQAVIDPETHWNVYRNMLRRGRFHNPHLQHAWNKYGEDVYEFIVLDNSPKTQTQLDDLEIQFILERGYYNLKSGGHGGLHNEETKKKISKNNARYWQGKHRSSDDKKKMSDAKKKNPVRFWKGKKRPPHSLETRRKMSEAALRRWNRRKVNEKS